LLRGSAEKQPITREQFDNDLVDSPFLKSFRYGKNHEGYWTNRHMKLQLEDVVDCLRVAFPDFDFLFLFDQSSGHTKKRDDGLSTQNMNVEFGGKVSEMRHSHLLEGCIGPFAAALCEDGQYGIQSEGEVQMLVFPESTRCSEEDGPYWLTYEERLRRRDDKFLEPFLDKAKTTSELRKELADAGVSIGRGNAMENWQRLAQDNGIELTRCVDTRVDRAKTCAELVTDIQATRLTLEQRKYHLKELQELAVSCELDIRVVERKKIEGWAGKPKGLLQVLWETGWIDPELPRSKYNKAGKKGRDFDENGKLKPEIAHLILTNLMASRPDFAVEKSDLEHLADELGCVVRFTAKYHCEIAGEGIENGWGFSKKIYCRLPIAKKRYLDVFTNSVKNCLIQVTPERARRFSRRCRKYMLAYQKIVDEADGESTATASLERIETLVDTCFVATTNSSKKKRKKLVGSGPTKKDFDRRMSVETIYSIRGTKCQALQGPDEEAEESERLERLDRSNEDVDLGGQQRELLVHRSQLDTDTAYLSNEVELYLLQGNSRVE
jgi:hypothetical protein